MNSTVFNSFKVPSFTLPKFVARIGGALPQWPHALALTAALNTLVKTKFLSINDLETLEGRSFLIDTLDTGTQAAFTYQNGWFLPSPVIPEMPDLTFRANLSAFLQMATRQEDPDTLFFNRDLAIEGDTELGLIVKNMLDAMEWPRFTRAHTPAYE